MKTTLADRIKAAREAKGMTRAELARRVKISSTAMTFLEEGHSKDLQGSNVFPMADALGVSARWLLTGKEPAGSAEAPEATKRDEMVARLAQALAMVDEERLAAVMTLLNLRR